jgi:hypothetical protein
VTSRHFIFELSIPLRRYKQINYNSVAYYTYIVRVVPQDKNLSSILTEKQQRTKAPGKFDSCGMLTAVREKRGVGRLDAKRPAAFTNYVHHPTQTIIHIRLQV